MQCSYASLSDNNISIASFCSLSSYDSSMLFHHCAACLLAIASSWSMKNGICSCTCCIALRAAAACTGWTCSGHRDSISTSHTSSSPSIFVAVTKYLNAQFSNITLSRVSQYCSNQYVTAHLPCQILSVCQSQIPILTLYAHLCHLLVHNMPTLLSPLCNDLPSIIPPIYQKIFMGLHHCMLDVIHNQLQHTL